jgi:transposase InsO family protein
LPGTPRSESPAVGRTSIFNSDQDVRFTAQAFVACPESANVKLNMNARGSAANNIFVERLRRTVKYAEFCLTDYVTVPDLYNELESYFFYNTARPHQGLAYRIAAELHFGSQEVP